MDENITDEREIVFPEHVTSDPRWTRLWDYLLAPLPDEEQDDSADAWQSEK
jgi:hypothetical protein